MVRGALGRLRALALACLAGIAGAQDFGQNKVQYHKFDWSYLQTPHFDIYHAQGGGNIARFAAAHMEEMYASVSRTVGHKVENRVPVLLYNSHAEFEQTNVSDLPLQEGIGGFTEIFKNRIVLPFEGDYVEFRHVLQHEMTHAVVFDMLFGNNAAAAATRQVAYQFPLWVNEGLAEYASLGWDLSSEFFMLDATTFGYVQPPTTDFGGFLAYKAGQNFLYFVDQAYGPGTVTRLVQELRRSRDLPEAFKRVTKTSLEEAGEIWLRELRYIYWPELGQRQYGKSVARQLTDHGKDLSFYNLQPSISPDGKQIAFFSDREEWEAIYLLDVKTEKVTRTVVQGGKAGKHESFHSFKSGIAWSPDGKRLAVVSKVGGKDVLHLIDAKNGRVRREIKPPVDAIVSPAWSRDGRYLAFSGTDSGLTDLWLWDLNSDSGRRLTHDIALDDKPAFSPSGHWIAFESNRPGPERDTAADPLAAYPRLLKYKDIYRINLAGDTLQRVASGAYDEKEPSYGPGDSELVFVSNRSGLDNIYLSLDSAGVHKEKPLTNLLSGCFTPSWSRDGKLMAFSLFERGGWDIFLMKDPKSKARDTVLPLTHFMKAQQDSSVRFFRPINFANLSSFNADSLRADSLRRDSTARAARRDSVAKAVAGARRDSTVRAQRQSADRAMRQALGKPPAADSARARDSAAAMRDSLKAKADTAVARGDSAAAPGPADSLARFPGQDSVEAARIRSFLLDSARYVDPLGHPIERKYRPKFSLDMANAALAYDNLYGPAGMAFLTLSDLMGDQQISFALAVNSDRLSNTDAFVAYDFLPYQPDFYVQAFHQAQYTDYYYLDHENGAQDSIFQVQEWGFHLGLRYPLSTFTRWQFDLQLRNVYRTQQTVDRYGDYADSAGGARQGLATVYPSLGWVHDNSLWGLVGPINGERMFAGVSVVPPWLQERYAYAMAETDMRKYWEFARRYTLAARVSAGASHALAGKENPQAFLVGGEDFTLFFPYANPRNLRTGLSDYFFSDFDMPLRGFRYAEFRGDRKFIANMEFRFPFVREFSVLWPIPMALRDVMGTILWDYGGAWYEDENPFDHMGMGTGFGMRLNLGIFVLRYTRAWSVTIDRFVGNGRPLRDYWSLGAEF